MGEKASLTDSPMSPPSRKPGSTQVVHKNVSAIHISASLSILQRKLVNAMLYHAYYELVVEDTHTIPVALLMEMIGFESRNQDHLKRAIRGLTEKSVEWDIMEDDGTAVWEVSTLLSYASIRKGVCTYRYDKSLAEKLRHPDVFAKINLSVVRDIRSVHSLVLYENCYRYIGVGQTPRWPVDVFRRLMAVSHLASYRQFKVLKRDVILPAMKEVNKVSNIQVELETVMQGRSVVAVQFRVRPNPQLSLVGMNEEDEVTSSEAYRALLKEGINKRLAYDWVVTYGSEYVLEKIDLVTDRAAKGKIRSSRSGFLRSAINEDFHSDVAEKREQKAVADKAKSDLQLFERRLEEAKRALKETEKAYRETCIASVSIGLSELEVADAATVVEEFLRGLSSKIFVDEFKRAGWSSPLLFPDVTKFWGERGLIFPASEEAIHPTSKATLQSLRQEVKELEAQLL